MIRIQVPERGSADLDAATWDALQAEPNFQLLLEASALTALHIAGGGVRLRGGCFVGHALCGEYRIEVHEKIPGALLALIRFARRGSFQVAALDAQATEIGPLLRELIRQFLQLLGSYISRGREFTYFKEKRSGPLAGGRLNIVRTLGLRARGLSHLLAFDMPKISFKTPVNFVFAAALREIERLAEIIEIEPESLATARGCSLMFSDCRDYRLLASRRSDLADIASSLANKAIDDNLADMLSIARVILAHQSFEPDRFVDQRSPRTWFINLELLFEQAVRGTMARSLAGSGREVINGREHSVPIFTGEVRVYRANPDIVVRGGGKPASIGDVKYKDFDRVADAGDVYQLLAHTGAFRATQCFLIYPGEAFAFTDLGKTADGHRLCIATVDLRQLPQSVDQMLEHLALREAPRIAA